MQSKLIFMNQANEICCLTKFNLGISGTYSGNAIGLIEGCILQENKRKIRNQEKNPPFPVGKRRVLP